MNSKKSPFSILNNERREMNYIKGIYKKRIQAEIESYKDTEDGEKKDTIQVQDILMPVSYTHLTLPTIYSV